MAVDPDDPFPPAAHVEEGVSRRGDVERPAEKLAWRRGRVGRAEAQGGELGPVERQAENLPIHERHVVEGDALGDPLAIEEQGAEIDPPHGFDEDIERRVRRVGRRDLDLVFLQAAIERPQVSAVDVDIGVIVELDELQLAAPWPTSFVRYKRKPWLWSSASIGRGWGERTGAGRLAKIEASAREPDLGRVDGGRSRRRVGQGRALRRVLRQDLAQGEILRRRPARLVEGRVVVVARHVGLIRVAVIGAGPEPEVRPAVEQVEVEGLAVFEEPGNGLHEVLGFHPGPRLAPVREPAGVELAAENGNVPPEPGGLREVLLLRPGVEPDGGARHRAGFEHVRRRAVGRIEGDLEARFYPDLLEPGHVAPVVAVAPVLVFELEHQDGTAPLNLEPADLVGETADVAGAGFEIPLVAAADLDVGNREEPGRQSAEVPFGAGVRARPDDDPEAGGLRLADERGHIVPAGEVEAARLGFECVPENIRANGVEAHGARHEEPLPPVFPGDALEMQLPGDHLERPAVQDELRPPETEGVGARRRDRRPGAVKIAAAANTMTGIHA